MGKLVGAVKAVVASKGYLVGLDGRRISIRSDHAALNSLLQSAGALLMKRAAVLLFEELTRAGIDFWFVLNIHDEWQIEVAPEQATEAGKLAAEAIRRAGDFYSFRCPLAGNYVIGNNWAETH
jgi:DNA polymerase I-like protein with 3'-5' exonuclease and polymerase domains